MLRIHVSVHILCMSPAQTEEYASLPRSLRPAWCKIKCVCWRKQRLLFDIKMALIQNIRIN